MATRDASRDREDDPLAPYRRKRDFTRTPEPAGVPAPRRAGARRFVVQRHRARRLHYDVRFEIDGVLVSWAVPRGPTLDPDVRRLAVHVEDHPLAYENFEGVIPAGEYGGGDVIVWDRGTWEPFGTDDPAAAVRAGNFHADLHGERLRGRFVLVRTGADRDGGGRDNWLMLHKHDRHAVPGWDAEDHSTSVLTGRTNEEVRTAPDWLWRSDLPPGEAAVRVDASAAVGSEEQLERLAGLGSEGTWTVFGRRLRVANLDQVLFPGRHGQPPVTKRELLAYTARIAPVVLPYLRGRALDLHRYPDGAAAPGTWLQGLPGRAPRWVPRWRDPAAERDATHLVVDEPAALVWAVGFAGLEWHPWASRTDAPDLPTYALFDIDPGEHTPWGQVVEVARLHRAAFEHLGVRAYPELTGRRGIQVWVPIARGPSVEQTRRWVETVSRTVGRVVPDAAGWVSQTRERAGRARPDTQNMVNETLIAPYSPRAEPGAPVSVPVDWGELDDPDLRPDGITIRTVLDRLESRGDLFRGVLVGDQNLPAVH